jgi:hypothetical protein
MKIRALGQFPVLGKVPKSGSVRGLQVCASCEWVFRFTSHDNPDEEGWRGCPVCGFGYYRATLVYPRHKCLRFACTQEPWRKKKHAVLEGVLDRFISEGKFDHELPSGKLPLAGR